MSLEPNDLLTSKQLAALLHVTDQTVRRYRSNGQGPRYTKLGKGKSSRVLYWMRDVEEFLRQNILSFAGGVRGIA